MFGYIVRRLLYTVPIVFGVLLITFILFKVVPGDPSYAIAGKNASAERIAEIQKELGFDKPKFLNFKSASQLGWHHLFDSQFFYAHLYKTVTFQFGRTIQTKERVSGIILRGAGPSLCLTVPMFAGILLTSLSLSLFVAFLRATMWDKFIVVLCVLGMSIPSLAFIMFGQWYLAGKLDWFPVHGYESGLAGIPYLVLPVLIGVVAGLGSNVRFYRTVMLDEINCDYIRTAYAKGVSTPRVLFVHVLKNAMIPVLTNVVLAIPFLFLGSLLLERFFGIPGLGYLMIDAINSREYPVISAMTYIIALLFVMGNLATDISYSLVDPRISLS